MKTAHERYNDLIQYDASILRSMSIADLVGDVTSGEWDDIAYLFGAVSSPELWPIEG